MEGGHAAGGGGSFINKPARGWLHPDHQLAEEGICYGVRYIGCLKVNTSMKSLNFDTRSLIAKECISRVCEAAGLKTADRKRKVVKTIGRILGERPMMEHAGSNVNLTITSTALTLSILESGQVVACHDMPNISFASGGDPDTLDFIAYVAKDSRYGRACFVLECGGGLAQDVITTIGQAFELRFKEYLKRTPSVQYTSVKSDKSGMNGEGAGWGRDDRNTIMTSLERCLQTFPHLPFLLSLNTRPLIARDPPWLHQCRSLRLHQAVGPQALCLQSLLREPQLYSSTHTSHSQEKDTLDFIAYVAKDSRYGRACFVLECGGGLAQDVITTIGQAFELRFKEYLKRTPSVQYTSVKSDKSGMNGEGAGWGRDDPEYYNDLPGKVPPDLPPPPVPPLPQYSASDSKRPTMVTSVQVPATSSSSGSTSSVSPVPSSGASTILLNSHQPLTGKVSDNLIDFTSEGAQPPPMRCEPEYVNDAVIKQKQLLDQRDPFDMQPFITQLSQLSGGVSSGSTAGAIGGAGAVASGTVPSSGAVGGNTKPLPLNQRLQLQREPWFHGAISRKEAEMLLVQDGDFLVRESQGTAGQYVLTGMQNNTKKHLLLVDPEGVVRTKSRTFDSVSHLINYHRDNELPIVSAESALVLRNPVLRRIR
nr:SHC-transforming protein 1-like [Penaeus vannamei]